MAGLAPGGSARPRPSSLYCVLSLYLLGLLRKKRLHYYVAGTTNVHARLGIEGLRIPTTLYHTGTIVVIHPAPVVIIVHAQACNVHTHQSNYICLHIRAAVCV